MIVNDLEAASLLVSLLSSQSWIVLRYENLSWPARVLDARGDLVVADRAAAELLGASVWALAYGQNSVAARSAAEQALAAARRHPPPSPTLEPWISALSEAIMAGDGGRALDLVAETFALDGALSYGPISPASTRPGLICSSVTEMPARLLHDDMTPPFDQASAGTWPIGHSPGWKPTPSIH